MATTLTADRSLPVSQKPSEIGDEILTSGSTAFQGGLAMRENVSPTTIKPATDTAGHTIVGMFTEAIVGDGVRTVKYRKVGEFGEIPFTPGGLDKSNLGDPVYADADGSVTNWANSTNKLIVGHISRIVSATVCDVIRVGNEKQMGILDTQKNTNQGFIPIALTTLRETTNFDVGNIAANGGILASDTTPVLDAINAATDGCQRALWAASNNDQVVFQTPLPPELDVASDVVVHMRIVSAGTTDAVGFTVDSFFNEGDTKVVDTSGTNQTATWAEVTATIAAADVPAGAQTLTVGLTPVAHTTDTLAMSAVWIEYTKTDLAA